MRILCISQNTPSELDPIIDALAGKHEVFAAAFSRGKSRPGIRRLHLKRCEAGRDGSGYLGHLAYILRTAKGVEAAWNTLNERGDAPRLILACASNGMGLGLRAAFPNAVLASYPDSRLCCAPDADFRAARALAQEIRFAQSNLRFLRFPQEKKELTKLGEKSFIELPLFVDTAFYAPAAKERDKIVICGGCPHEELEKLCRVVLDLAASCRLFILAENTLRRIPFDRLLAVLPEKLRERVTVDFAPTREKWKEELAAASLLFCPRADASVMQRLLEGMACACPVLTANHFSFLAGNALPLGTDWSGRVKNALADAGLSALGAKARANVLAKHEQAKILPAHIDLLLQSCAGLE